MPIRPENRDRYPKDWKAISERIRFGRARGRCECSGQCGGAHSGGRCFAPHLATIARKTSDPAVWEYEGLVDFFDGLTTINTGGLCEGTPTWQMPPVKVVLTVAHLDHTPENCDDSNLLALCQRCHLRMDRDHHAETRRRTRDAKSGQQGLFS